MTCDATMWVGLSSARKTAVAAAMPEPNIMRLVGALQRRDQRFGLLDRDVVGAAIDVAAAVAVVGIAQIGCRHMDRRNQRLRRRIAGTQRLAAKVRAFNGGWV